MSQKIFVKIASLDDSELKHTIYNAVHSAEEPDRLVFGIFLNYKNNVAKEELEDYVSELCKYSYFKLRITTYSEEFIGVGKARGLVDDMYSDEDYILQIDAHTWFAENWDTTLINLLKQTPDKTILTGYATPYKYINNIRIPEQHGFLLPQYTNKNIWNDWTMNWTLVKPTNDVDFIDTKFCANFAFSSKEWGAYSGLHKQSVFWSEEPLQTINLLNNDFKLLYPNINEPVIGHLYSEDIVGELGKRLTIEQSVGEEKAEYLMNVVDRNVYLDFFRV